MRIAHKKEWIGSVVFSWWQSILTLTLSAFDCSTVQMSCQWHKLETLHSFWWLVPPMCLCSLSQGSPGAQILSWEGIYMDSYLYPLLLMSSSSSSFTVIWISVLVCGGCSSVFSGIEDSSPAVCAFGASSSGENKKKTQGIQNLSQEHYCSFYIHQ